jgi:hypothetical protein
MAQTQGPFAATPSENFLSNLCFDCWVLLRTCNGCRTLPLNPFLRSQPRCLPPQRYISRAVGLDLDTLYVIIMTGTCIDYFHCAALPMATMRNPMVLATRSATPTWTSKPPKDEYSGVVGYFSPEWEVGQSQVVRLPALLGPDRE